MTQLDRSLLRSQAADAVRDLVCSGQLAAGDRIGEAATARALGISRTPLREALILLSREGLVVASPLQGFRVAPLVEAEVRDLYPILGTIEALAVTTIPTLALDVRQRLSRINDRFRQSRTPVARIRCDSEWHEVLLESSTNATARQMAADLRRRVMRYELAYMEQQGVEAVSTEQHEQIVQAITDGDHESAARLIEAQWRDSVTPLLDWIHASSEPSPTSDPPQ
ncbi:MAG: GntR family transcriptional regulator [Planctomycetota bacterium]